MSRKQPQRVLLAFNPDAGSGHLVAEDLVACLETVGISVVLCRSEKAEQADQAIVDHQDEVDSIVVAGGDGSLNGSVEAILESGLPLGVLPCGTANDLARTLEIPEALDAAARVIANGQIKRIDLGVVNDKHFFNVASIGLAAQVSSSMDSALVRNLGILSYPVALVDAYRGSRSFRAKVTCNDSEHAIRSIQIAIGNGRHYGGGLVIRDDADIDDDQLHCYSLKPQTLWELLRSSRAIMRGTLRNRPHVWLMDSTSFEIQTDRPMRVNTDGILTAETPVNIHVEKQVLPVYVPEPARRERRPTTQP